MKTSTAPGPIRGYTTSIRTGRGRLLLHVEREALEMLGGMAGSEASLLATLNRHMPRFHALALQMAAREMKCEVCIRRCDVWWPADEGLERRQERGRNG